MSPEQAEGKPVDARADLYSLGALMYALLARRPVFHGKSLAEMIYKQRFESPEPLRKLVPEAPEELERILQQLLQKEPDQRMPNADILARRLEAMLHGLRLGPETVDAGAHWFDPEEAAPAAKPEKTLPFSEDFPVTQPIHPPLKAVEAAKSPVAQLPASPAEPSGDSDGQKAPDTAPRPPASATRFVAVSEDELGKTETDEEPPRPSTWWQTLALVAALVLMFAVAQYLLRPPSAESLYKRIAATTADGSIDSKIQAERDIGKFLSHFGNDPRAETLRGYEKDIELYRLQLRLQGLADGDPLPPVERAYVEAINYARLDPELGAAKLQAIVDLYAEPGNNAGPTGRCLVLAQRRLAELRDKLAKQSAGELALIEDRLDAADALRHSSPKSADAMYRAVVELYAGKPWAAAVVGRARTAIGEMKKGKPERVAPVGSH
jgi:serine/threonine-protein kinase